MMGASLDTDRPLRLAAAQAGVRDARVLDAIDVVDRREFVPAAVVELAGEDAPIGIGHGQTTSQPSLVGRILEDLDLRPGSRVLEVGTGTGYEATLAGVLVAPGGHVVTIERDARLARHARRCIAAATSTPQLRDRGIDVRVRAGDGMLGAPDDAPFAAIIVAAACTRVPADLLDQLADLGRLIVPVQSDDGTQLLRFDRHGDHVVAAGSLGEVRYVPLLPGTVGD